MLRFQGAGYRFGIAARHEKIIERHKRKRQTFREEGTQNHGAPRAGRATEKSADGGEQHRRLAPRERRGNVRTSEHQRPPSSATSTPSPFPLGRQLNRRSFSGRSPPGDPAASIGQRRRSTEAAGQQRCEEFSPARHDDNDERAPDHHDNDHPPEDHDHHDNDHPPEDYDHHDPSPADHHDPSRPTKTTNPRPTKTTVPLTTTTTTSTTTTTTLPAKRSQGGRGVSAKVLAPQTPRAATTSTTAPPAKQGTPSGSSQGAGCKADPAAAIAALPPGGVFNGSGCYVTDGILVTKPVTINGGTYDDPVNENTGRSTVLPIIRVKDTSDVIIENVGLNGANLDGGFHRGLVGQAGLDILSSSHVIIANVSTNNTFGDGMTLFANFGRDSAPVTDLFVNGLTVTKAGRQGITMGYVKTRRSTTSTWSPRLMLDGISRVTCPTSGQATSPSTMRTT